MRGSEGKNAAAAQELRDQAEVNGWDLHVLELDVTDQSAVDHAVAFAIDQAGRIDVLINNAGVGTFGSKMIQAREAERLEGYGSTKELFSTMAQTFAEREYQDPQLVVDALVELAESDPADRPLRLPVGEDSKMASTPINEAQEQAQKAIMAHFGWD